jgi:hypothetical protein
MRPDISGTIISVSARVFDHLLYSSTIARPYHKVHDTYEHVYLQEETTCQDSGVSVDLPCRHVLMFSEEASCPAGDPRNRSTDSSELQACKELEHSQTCSAGSRGALVPIGACCINGIL